MPFFFLFFAYTKKRRWIIVFLLASSSSYTFASELVTIQLSNGHQVSGVISEERNDSSNHLWLVRTAPGIQLVSGFPREKITSVIKHGDSEELPPPIDEKQNEKVLSNSASAPAKRIQKVVTVETYACVKNWDGDSQADGIEIIVKPLDNQGNIVPVSGTIDFQMLGQRTAWRTSEQIERFHEFGVIDTWTKRLQPNLLRHDGYHFRLEFRNTHPDFDLDLELEAMIHSRLNLIGQTALESNSGPVLLRPFSKLRDDRQQFTGSRFFAEEHPVGF